MTIPLLNAVVFEPASFFFSLDLAFHLNRQTGALSKTIDRGSRGITTILNAIVFNIVPTAFELALVTSILAVTCGPKFSGVAIGAVASYAAFTLSITSWRTKFRLNMNRAENEAGNRAIDSLINYETGVAVIPNDSHHFPRDI